jgi:hypothetical protein
MTTQWNDVPAPTGKEALSRTYAAGHRTDVIDVPIQGNNGQLEYMIRMRAGETVVYSWEVVNISHPQSFYTEFHGHTEAAPGRPGDLMFLREGVRLEGERLFDRSLAGHPRLVLAKQERRPGGGTPTHGRVLRTHSGSGRTARGLDWRLMVICGGSPVPASPPVLLRSPQFCRGLRPTQRPNRDI